MGCKIRPSDQVSFLVWNPQNVNWTLLDGRVSAIYPWLVVCNGSYTCSRSEREEENDTKISLHSLKEP